MRSSRSNTVTSCPGARELLRGGEAGGAGADDGDLLARLDARETLRTAPSSASNARSMMPRSTSLMVTGSSSMLSTHDASQGAGQTRPVTSGKLLVACSAPTRRRGARCRRGRSSRG